MNDRLIDSVIYAIACVILLGLMVLPHIRS